MSSEQKVTIRERWGAAVDHGTVDGPIVPRTDDRDELGICSRLGVSGPAA